MASISSSPGRTKFGDDPELYDFARPGYPEELFDWLRKTCGLGAETGCFEIGAGTGQATLPILATPVRSILAIEPDTALAESLRAKAGDDTRLQIAVNRFETTHLEDGDYDFGYCATAFHWLARMKAFDRILSALRPGGYFAMWWNVFHDPASPDAFDTATEHLFDGLEQDPEATASRPAFALDVNSRLGEMRSAGFADVQHRLFRTEVAFSPQRLAALYNTLSRVRMAPDVTRAHLLSEVERTVKEQFGGEIARTVVCSAFVGRRP